MPGRRGIVFAKGNVVASSAAASTAASSKPNFVVFLTDDQGPWAMPGLWPELHMPNLASIMSEGTTLSNFYCASPVCSPARASLMTGRMPSAHGVHDWLVGERGPECREDSYIDNLVTLPKILNNAGYQCGMSGKWHIGSSRWPAPGFDYWYAHRIGGGPYYGAPVWSKDGKKVAEPRYLTYAIAEEAAKFLDSMAAGQAGNAYSLGRSEAGINDGGATKPAPRDDVAPFYLQIDYTAPHDPWINNHPQDLYDIYADCDFPTVPRLPRHPWNRPRREWNDVFDNPIPSLAGYAASLSGVDRTVGLIVDRLKQLGVYDNTIIVFLADNGFSCGHHGIWGKGNGTWPLNFWENSVRVPFVMAGPGICAGKTVTDHVSAASFLSTICDLAGVTPDEDPLRAGGSFAPLVTGDKPGNGADSVVVYDEYGQGRMIRSGDYKFIDRHGDAPKELYNLADDPDEEHNLVDDAKYASVRKELSDGLHDWFAAHEDAVNSAFDRLVGGHGQLQPPSKGLDDAHTYCEPPKPVES